MKHWKKLSSKTVHTNPWWTVEEHDVTRPDGTPGKYFIAQRAAVCSVVAIRPQNEVCMIYQERYATGQSGWELPQGIVDPGEKPLAAAQRELKEESGLVAKKVTDLGAVESEKGITNAFCHVFVATGLTQNESTGQLEEGIMDCKFFPLAEIKAMIRRDDIHDSLTLASLYLAEIHGHLS